MPEAGIIRGYTFNLPADNIDTDQIYPARFLTTTVSEGLGEKCFHDWRHDPGSRYHEAFLRFQPGVQKVLVAGSNFGCGSSREHAAWSLLDMGFEAVISTRFGDIFYNNALKNGLVPVQIGPDAVQHLMQHDRSAVEIDLASRTVSIPGLGIREFPLDPFASHCLTRGIDSLDYLLSKTPDIDVYEAREEPAA
jgi:3-isopropylmalate/(R)-2-methylmalate dehydratase small subunit